jgi:hypothetical protein
VGRFQVFETPLALDRYKQASTDLLAMLDRVAYPALREDPANESGKYPIRFRPGGFTFEIEARVDASRALDVLGHLQGRSVREAIELLSSVQPGRTPRPVKDIRHLLNPGLRIPRSVLQPIKPPQPGIRGPEATESGQPTNPA